MAKYKRYQGEFISVDGVLWRAEIWQEADEAFASVDALEFDADEPLVIEWANRAKEEVICGATATLKIVSPGDRTYADMYSVDVNRVRLDVYRNGLLYWSGAMDTEFYEEPYEALSGYVVSLTFTDFGVWDRLKYDLTGLQTIGDIIDNAITRAGFMCGGVDASLISTKLDATTALTLDSIKVNSSNFYDEDGEASTLAEVIAGVLQPLALRIVQRAGKVRVYDLNAVYHNASVEAIEWDGDSQTMGVDSVYNNAKVTWSPYAQGGDLLPDKCWPEDIKTPAYLTALEDLDGEIYGDATYYSYHYSTELINWGDPTDVGFTLWLTTRGEGVELLDSSARFFKIVPQLDGSDTEGIAIKWCSVSFVGGSGSTYTARYYGESSVAGAYPNAGAVAFRSAKVWLPPVDNPSGLLVKIRLESLIDVRFNPFEAATNMYDNAAGKDKTHSEQLKKYGNFIYIPVWVRYQPDGSNKIYTWSNQSVVGADPNYVAWAGLQRTLGEWIDSSSTHGYLAYYSAEDRVNETGAEGWQPNRPAINPHPLPLRADLTGVEGQYIPYPPYGPGKLWLEVGINGWQIIDCNSVGDTALEDATNGVKDLHDKIKWALFKCPEIEVVNNRQFEPEIESDDVEYSAELNAAAKEEIAIDTICGTSAEGVPTARGAYYRANNNEQIKTLTRADRTTQAEDLLIGTLYSQYAQRRTMLSGETTLLANAVAAYTEANQEGKVFIALEDLQDLRAATSDATFVELRPDEYKRNNE